MTDRLARLLTASYRNIVLWASMLTFIAGVAANAVNLAIIGIFLLRLRSVRRALIWSQKHSSED